MTLLLQLIALDNDPTDYLYLIQGENLASLYIDAHLVLLNKLGLEDIFRVTWRIQFYLAVIAQQCF